MVLSAILSCDHRAEAPKDRIVEDRSRVDQATIADTMPGRIADQSAGLCPPPPGGLPSIAADSLAYFSVRSTLERLRGQCPAARDTLAYGETTDIGTNAYPAMSFRFADLTLTAVQYRKDLAPEEPPDAWIIAGSRGVLPGGVPLEASWAELQRSYGKAVGNAEVEVSIRFCAIPFLIITLGTTPQVVGSIEVTGDLSRIPLETRITRVLLLTRQAPPAPGC